ncbi:hypothetical protein FV233_24870 [Methylobacterium sp. WL7]|nr:hypothetical protein FV233_24870 [Methylobacterium sp. WL7]
MWFSNVQPFAARSPTAYTGFDRSRDHAVSAEGAGPLSRAGEGQGEGCALSGKPWSLTPALSRTGEGARRGLNQRLRLKPM